MRIPRIFQSIPLAAGQVISLDPQASAHLTRVLRLKPGDALVVFNGDGKEYEATVEAVERRAASINIGRGIDRNVESPLELILIQGVSRGERMDYTVQKAVELGVARIVPVMTRRTVVNLKGDRLQRRRDHWQSIVNSACEQCGRNVVPEVSAIRSLEDWLCEPIPGHKFVLHHRADQNLADSTYQGGPVTLLIGPEGGLSTEEITAAQQAGYEPLCLGPRVLRTETAAVAALSVLQWLWGDLSTLSQGKQAQ